MLMKKHTEKCVRVENISLTELYDLTWGAKVHTKSLTKVQIC